MTSVKSARVAMMIESDGPGGAEMVMLQLSEELHHRGYDIVPVLPEGGVGWLGERYRDQGFAPETFSLRGPLDPRCLSGIVRTLREREVDLVHSHEFAMAVYGSAAARFVGLPHVVTWHANMGTLKVFRRRVALRLAFRWSAGVVAVSDHTRRHLEQVLQLPTDRVTTILNGVPRPEGDGTAIRRQHLAHEDELLLLAAGSLMRRKGHHVLLEALGQIRQEVPSLAWRLLIAGRGVEKDRLEGIAGDVGISSRVHFLGYRSDIPDLLAAADIFVMPSLWEGLPLAILEAMRSGTAVVASACSGIPEAICHGRDGILVEPGDQQALRSAMVELMTDPARRESIASVGKERAEREFTIERMTDRYEALYRRA